MRRSRRTLSDFHGDTGGAVIIWVSVLLLAIIALVGIAVDGARILNLNSNLQEIADAAALAGAKELDGSADAITRATKAALSQADNTAQNLNNTPRWSDDGSSGVQIVATGPDKPTFYTTVGGAPVTDPKLANYIKVTTVSREVSATFSYFNGMTSMSTKATAMAKSSFSVCAPLQSFICNPWETEQANPGRALNWLTKISPGQQLVLTGGTKGAPGNWGLLQAPEANGNPHNQAAFWAKPTPQSCAPVDISQVAQEVDTGNNGPFAQPGMNVRFDNPQNNLTNTAGPIVIDGFAPDTNNSNAGNCANTDNKMKYTTGNGKNAVTTTLDMNDASSYRTMCADLAAAKRISCPLPRDRTWTNLGGNSWSTSLAGAGAQTPDLQAYWTNHHTGSLPANFLDPDTGKNVPVTTRWQIYQMENDTAKYPTAAFTTGGNSSENLEPSRPFCDASKPAGDITRRLINVAVVDCEYWRIKGASNYLPVTTLMAEFFMTEPADSNGKIYGELVKTYQVNGSGSNIYQNVQLVR